MTVIDSMNIQELDFRLLQCFAALLTERSVSRAAAQLELSQPAMSHALGRLRRLFDDPLLLKGQIKGGVSHGIGQILLEDLKFDPESGQLLTGSFMDYAMPRADDFPAFTIGHVCTHCTTNPFGTKGGGEAGAIGSPPAVMNAVLDALAPLGVKDLDMPASPNRVWNAIQQAKA